MADGRESVLVVDDDAFTRSMLIVAFERLGFDPVCAASARDALECLAQKDPTLAVLDLDLGNGPTGLDLAVAIQGRQPGIAILLITVFRSPALVSPTAKLSPKYGYLVKDDITSLDVLRSAVKDAFDRQAKCALLPAEPTSSADAPTITPTQAEVLRLVAMGLSNEAIAARRFTTTRSVEATIQRIYGRLGVTGRGERNPRVEAARMYRASEVRVGR